MKIVLFSLYYAKLQMAVQLGLHNTCYPLGLGWRWRYWKRRYLSGRRDSF